MFNMLRVLNNLHKLSASNLTTIQERRFTYLLTLKSKQHNQLSKFNCDFSFIRYKSDDMCCEPCDKPIDSKNQLSNKRFGNFNKKWLKDRFIICGLIVTMPLALIYPTHIGDVFFISAIMMHQHWGIEGIVRDYARELYYGKTIPKLSVNVVRFISILVTFGLFYFTFKQCCIGESVRKFWSIRGGITSRKD